MGVVAVITAACCFMAIVITVMLRFTQAVIEHIWLE